MSAWSPTLEGFRSVFRRPALPLAEIAWRWSFGATACILFSLSFLEYLDTLPISKLDLLLLRSRQPWLISEALAHIFHGSGLRFVLAGVLLFSALAILWIFAASLGRAATLDGVLQYIRDRALAIRQGNDSGVTAAEKDAPTPRAPWRFSALAGLHFLRAALALAACAGCVGAIILAGFISSDSHPHPGLTFFLALVILLLVWMAWSSLSWFLSLASIFVVGHREDTLGALTSAVALCRDRFGPVMAVGTWFGIVHLVVFVAATSVVSFPLAFVRVLPVGLVLLAVAWLTLLYFAIVDSLYVGRLTAYVAILEAPPVAVSAAAVSSEPRNFTTGSQRSALSIQPATAAVDQSELILSDQSSVNAAEATIASLKLSADDESAAVDQEELILSDDASPDPHLPGKSHRP